VRAHALALGLVASACVLSMTRSARADDDVYAQIIVDSTTMRSGPGGSFRRVYVAHRGEVFPVRERATRGYWFRVELPDATRAWVSGDAVYNRHVSDDEASAGRFLPWLLAPPPLPDAHGEVAMTFGVLSGGGFMAIRPTILLQPTFGLEITGAASVSRGGRLLIAGAGPIVNIFPRSPIIPFLTIGAGAVMSEPNADSFILQSGTMATMWGGGGLRIGFHHRITLRLDARVYAFYTPNRYVVQEEFSAGLTIFF
jgi:hypothetical protein